MEKSEDALIHAEHDRRTGHRTHQMRRQSAVEAHEALLDPDNTEALEETSILGG